MSTLLPFAIIPGRTAFLEAMSLSWLHPFFGASFISGELIAVIAMIGGMLLGGVIAISAIYFHHAKQKMWHETARIALERGQPVPPMPVRDEELALRPPPGVPYAEWHKARMAESRGNDFKFGLILLAIGAGLHLMLPFNSRAIGAIPGFIGVALLINALIQRLTTRRNSAQEDRPNQT